MNKVNGRFVNFCKFVILLVSAVLILFSCDNFLNGGEQKNLLEDRINYANAETSSIIIAAEEGTGSTIPSGNYNPKVGYSFSVSFSENSNYCFQEWIAVSRKDNETLDESIISFEDATDLKTNVTIHKNTGDIQIVPKCVKRIAIVGEPTPKYESNGVSRDRSIFVQFSKVPGEESFIFDENELPSGSTPIVDEAGKIWAYQYNNQTFLKNISITDSNEISIVEHFLQPKIEGNYLKIEVDKTNPIELESSTNKKTIKVTLSNKICDEEYGVRMNEERHWTYMINASTDEQAEIIISCTEGEGTLGNFGEKIIQKKYSIGYSLDLDFKESSDYQFIKWDFDSDFIAVQDVESKNTTATILSPTQEDKPVQIKAICAPRLRIEDFEPKNNNDKSTVSKNSSIIITFNENLPANNDGLSQLENITISVGGSPAKSSFLKPVVNENTITFTADKTNMLYVPAGQTKTVTVTIPSDLYYQLEDGTKVYLGGNGKTFDYKIDSSTLDKTEITFTASPNSGTVNPGAGTYKYSLEEEVNLSFKVNDGFTFNYWLVKDAEGNIVDDSEIKIDDRTSPNTKLTIYDILSGVNITAQCSEDFRVVEATPGRDKTNTKDSDIKITFNKDLNSGCSALLNKIKISIDGSIIDSYFETRSISGKTITIENTKYLSVDKDSKKQITVTVPKDFFYINGTEKVLLKEDYSFTYNIDYHTKEKSNIWIQIINGETGKIFENGITAATINTNGLEQLNIGETISVNLDVKKGYQFVGWQLVNENGNPVTNDFVKMSSNSMQNIELTALKPLEGAYLKALCYKRPAVLSGACSPRPTNLISESAKNAPIIVTFDKPIDSGCENAIELTYSGINFSKANNYKTSIDSDRKVVTLTNSKMPILSNAYETIYVRIPHEKIYYLTANNIKITMEEDEDWSFRINNRTLTNTTIRFDAARINVDGTTLSSPKETYNIEQVIPLQYNLSDDYTFNGWKIESATTGYIVEPSDFTKTGTIYIKSADDTNKNYLKMEIDSNNPLKGTITVLDSIGNGVNEYGVTVSISESKRPAVSSVSVSGTTTTVSRDTPVVITFDKNIISFTENLASTVRDYVTITSNGENITELYSANYNSGTNSLILTPASPTAIPVSGNYRDITVSLNASGVYYFDNVDTDSDGEVDHRFKTYLKDDYRFVYRVNPETSVKTEVQYLIDENSASNTDSIKIDSTFRTKEYKENYSVGKVTSLQYTPSSGYVFTGWKLLTDLEGYTVSPAGYVTSGTISVIKGSETYYTLEIDEENPTKAIGTVLKAMTENADGQTEQPSLKVFVRDAIIPTVKSNSTNGTTTIVPRDTEVSFTFNVEVEDFAKSGANSAIKVTSSGEDLTDLFNIVYNAERKTVTLTPKNPDAIPVTTKYRDVTVTVNKSLIVYKPYERADISINMKEDASFTYRVNSITTAKTSVQYVVGKCESSSSVSSIKIAGSSKESGELQEYSIGETVSLQYTAPVDYRFFGWKIESVNGYTVSPDGYVKEGTINVTKGDETYAVLSISDLDASKANLTIVKEMKIEDGSALTVSVMDGAIPKVVSNIPSNALLAVPRDSIVSFTFNVDIGEFSSDAIQVISGEENLLDRYSVRYSAETKTVTLVPLSPTAIPITSGTKSLRVSVIAENIIYSPLSGIFIGMEKDYSFTYKINTETSSKTRVEYAYGNDGNESSRKIKIDGVSRNLNEYKEECNVGQISALQYTVTPGYGFTGWKVEAISGYTVSPSGYVNSGTITVSRHGTNYYTLAIDEENPLKAVGTVLKAIDSEEETAAVTLSVSEVLIPVLSAPITPAYSSSGVPCDSNIVIPFNTLMDKTTITCSETGSIQIVNSMNKNEHYESYYSSSWSGNTLTLKPSTSIYGLLKEDEILTLQVIFATNRIKAANGQNLSLDSNDYLYRINSKREEEKPIVEKLDLYKAPYEYGEILNVGLANYILLSDKDISNFASADYTRNHINNAIRLDATVYDEESGFLKLTISETNISDSNKEYPPTEVLFPSYTASTGKYQYRYKNYQLRSEKNGLIKLTFNFEDVAGNVTQITRYVISDTILDEANIVVAQPSASPFKKTVKNTAINREIYSIPADGFVRETENGIDTVTFTFTNQKEVFYKNGSNSYSDYYSYQLDFGYEPNMYMAGSYRSKDNTFTIERDETKITYLKFTAYDSVGNSNSITRVLLPKTEISSIIKGPNAYGPYIIYKDQRYYESQLAAYGADEVWTYIMYKPVKFNETSAANTAYMQDGQNNYLISSYASRYSTYFVPPIYIINDTTTSYDSTHQANVRMPAGEYDIYVMPGLRYRGSEIIYGPVSEPHRIKVEYNESTKLNYIPESQYAAKPEITEVSNLVPSSAPVCTKTSAGLNSGMFVLNVSYPSGFTPLSGYTYYAKVASYFNASKYGTLYYPMDDSSISINVSGDDAYYVSIEARDTQGRAKESLPFFVNCRTDDNIAPTLNVYSSSVASIDDVSDAPGQSTLYYKYGYTDSWPKDNTGGSGIKVDANNNFTVEYWNIKNPLNTPDPVTYTNAQLNSTAYAKYKNTGIFKYVSYPSGQINSDAFVRLKYEDLDEGYYTLSIKIKDNNENYVLVNWPMYNIVLNWDFNLQCINNGTSVSPDWYIKADFGTKNPEGRAPSPTKIAFDIIDGNTETRIYDNITSEDRVKYPDPYFNSNKRLTSSPILDIKASNIYTLAPITSELVKNKFVKVIAKETGKGFYNYQYIYPDYYINKGTSSAITCVTKNILAGFGDNYQIYTDSPTYVHTMYWKENLGNSPSYWETRGIERGEKLDTAKYKRDFTYSVTDEMVPAGKGYWYVVVAHFADGSVIMTDPKQKN